MRLLALQRIRRQPARWLSLAFGFLVAGLLLSATAIYTDTMRATALTYALAQLPPDGVHLWVRLPTQRISQETFLRVQEAVASAMEGSVGQFAEPLVPVVQSATFYLRRGDTPLLPQERRPRGFLLAMGSLEQHLEVVEGRFPPPRELPKDDVPSDWTVPVLIGQEAATSFGLRVGDRLGLAPYWQDRFKTVDAVVVGIGRVREPQELYWAGRPNPLLYPEGSYQTLPMVAPQATLFQGVGAYFQRLVYDVSWAAPVQTDRLTPGNAKERAAEIGRLQTALLALPEPPTLTTGLKTTLETYTARLFFTGVPLTLLATQVVGITLLYLIILGFFLAERQRPELALLRSRGASTLQLLSPFVGEGALLTGLTLALAPLLAAGLIALLGLTPWLAPLSGQGLLPVALTPRAYLLAGLGAALGLVAFLVPAFLASRATGVQHRQRVARRLAPPFFLRYRLDVLLLAALVVLGWQLLQQGSAVRFTLAGQALVNPLLYVFPMLLVLASAMLFLRVFAPLLSLLARLLEPRAPAWLLLGLWYLARGPATSGALILLLALTTGTTLLAASFVPTLERHARERIFYQTGASLRVEGLQANLAGASVDLASQLSAVEGVRQVSSVYRGQGLDHTSTFGTAYTMLAVDPATLGDVAWYRDDFASQDLTSLLALLKEEGTPAQGLQLPREAERLGVWARPGRPGSFLRLYARVQDANGHVVDYPLGALNFTAWRYLDVPLGALTVPGGQSFRPQPPLFLLALVVEDTRGGETGPGVVYLDDVQVTGQGLPKPLVLEGFEQPDQWGVIQDLLERSPDSLDLIETSAPGGQRAAAFSWGSNSLFTAQGITPVPPTQPLPAIASTSFLAQSGRRIGERLAVSVFAQAVPLHIVGQVDFFPTLDPYEQGFLIVNVHRLLAHGRLLAPRGELLPNELWLAADEATAPRLKGALGQGPVSYRRVLDRQEALATAQVDPFVLGGWMGWLLLALGAMLVVSLAGFLGYAALEVERRQASVAVLESLGMPPRQVLGTVALELAVLLGLGALLGALMGSWLAALLLSILDVTGAGQAAAPPLVVVRTWGGVFLVYGGIGAVFGLLMALVLRWFSRLSLQRVLKLEEA